MDQKAIDLAQAAKATEIRSRAMAAGKGAAVAGVLALLVYAGGKKRGSDSLAYAANVALFVGAPVGYFLLR
jgi:hypothetical protein